MVVSLSLSLSPPLVTVSQVVVSNVHPYLGKFFLQGTGREKAPPPQTQQQKQQQRFVKLFVFVFLLAGDFLPAGALQNRAFRSQLGDASLAS